MSSFVAFVALYEIEPRSARVFDHEGQKVLIARLEGDDIRAYDGRCPHQGARLPAGPLVDGAFIECASHGAIFRATDGALQPGPVTCPGLTAWPVRIEDGQVAVAVPEKPAIDRRGRPPAWGPSVRTVVPESTTS